MNGMKRTASGLAALVIWQIAWFLVTIDGQGLRRMNTTVAREHVGETAIVCGQVIGAGCSLEHGAVMQLATNDHRGSFDFRIPLADRGKFGPYPEEQHLQKFICAPGRIESRGSGYEVVLKDPSSITVLPDRPGLPAFAAGVHRPCDRGVAMPKATREVKPSYTFRAMREQVAGKVFMQVVVLTDGKVGDARVVRGLHVDLDKEAVKAARGWQFEPGTLNGEPVPVVVTIEMTFTLRDGR
jgi:TonB family protein